MRLSLLAKSIAILPLFFTHVASAEVPGESQVPAAANAAVAGAADQTSKSLSMFDTLKACTKLVPGQPSLQTEKWATEVSTLKTTLKNSIGASAKMCGIEGQMEIFERLSAQYISGAKSCMEKNQMAGRNCLEKCSPNIQKIVSGSQVAMAGLSQMSIVDACSTMGKVLQIAQGGMTAYTAACSGTKALCDFSCSSALTSLANAEAAFARITVNPPDKGADCSAVQSALTHSKEELSGIAKAERTPSGKSLASSSGLDVEMNVADKAAECQGYAQNLLAAGLGIASAIQQGRQAAACEKATKGDTTASSNPCALAANKNTPSCICEANPRAPGCSQASDVTATGGFSNANGKGTDVTAVGTNSLGSGVDGSANPTTSGLAGSGGAGPAMGGGSGGAGGGLSGSNDGKGVAGGVITKTNTSIYGGEGGGGGGAYGSKGGGMSTQGQAALAGQIKQQREIASLKMQVSSGGGKSNFEKVKDGYVREKNNLLGQ